jgi:hypothetical protein
MTDNEKVILNFWIYEVEKIPGEGDYGEDEYIRDEKPVCQISIPHIADGEGNYAQVVNDQIIIDLVHEHFPKLSIWKVTEYEGKEFGYTLWNNNQDIVLQLIEIERKEDTDNDNR